MENEKINKAIHGDDDALVDYLKSISSLLLKTSMGLLGDKDQARDCISETIAKVYKHRKKVKQPEFFQTWIIRILINECKDELKRSKRYISLPEDFDIVEPIKTNFSFVKDTMENLPFELKQIIVLKFYNQLTFKEISMTLIVPESTIKSRYALALKKMKVELEALYD
ncbi:MAG: sigma-70 family RNA polymerase sigma factor [Erysipelotrichaceae bacterium]|jgi:RNA polymerase sigma-70 factor (ECF subfamily)|nr:sigma-70 family RNA polymerase sigma factor [Erysipelotrichaceae bacterium]